MENKLLKRITSILVIIFAGGQWLLPDVSWLVKIIITFVFVALVIIFECRDKIHRMILSRLGNFVASVLVKIGKFLWNSYSRLFYIFLLLVSISLIAKDEKVYYLSALMFLICLLSSGFEKLKFIQAPLFSDGFDDSNLTKRWKIETGSPDIDIPFGKPAPSLKLNPNKTRTHSLVSLKDLEALKNGIIECDVILKPGALVNICFRLQDNGTGYMARLDTRGGDDDDSFLEKTGDFSWEHKVHSNKISLAEQWHHVKLIIENNCFKFFKDDNLITEWKDNKYQKGKIGIFNELAEAHIDNFLVSRL